MAGSSPAAIFTDFNILKFLGSRGARRTAQFMRKESKGLLDATVDQEGEKSDHWSHQWVPNQMNCLASLCQVALAPSSGSLCICWLHPVGLSKNVLCPRWSLHRFQLVSLCQWGTWRIREPGIAKGARVPDRRRLSFLPDHQHPNPTTCQRLPPSRTLQIATLQFEAPTSLAWSLHHPPRMPVATSDQRHHLRCSPCKPSSWVPDGTKRQVNAPQLPIPHWFYSSLRC